MSFGCLLREIKCTSDKIRITVRCEKKRLVDVPFNGIEHRYFFLIEKLKLIRNKSATTLTQIEDNG